MWRVTEADVCWEEVIIVMTFFFFFLHLFVFVYVQLPVFILYYIFQIYQYPGVMCCSTEKPLHILMTLPLAFFYSCSEFYMFQQARVLPALLHLCDQMKFSVSVKNADALPLHAHCTGSHTERWHCDSLALQYRYIIVSLTSCILAEFYPLPFPHPSFSFCFIAL